MPKRSEKRDTAKAEYIARKARGEEVSLRETERCGEPSGRTGREQECGEGRSVQRRLF